jgi:hypothetical protein
MESQGRGNISSSSRSAACVHNPVFPPRPLGFSPDGAARSSAAQCRAFLTQQHPHTYTLTALSVSISTPFPKMFLTADTRDSRGRTYSVRSPVDPYRIVNPQTDTTPLEQRHTAATPLNQPYRNTNSASFCPQQQSTGPTKPTLNQPVLKPLLTP